MMTILTYAVFLPLMIALLLVSFHDGLRRRVLACRPVAAADAKLRRLDALFDGWGYWALFALILLIGVFSRCYRFCELPRGLNQDGTMAGVEALCLMNDGVDQYGASWPAYFRAWNFSQMSTLYSWLLIPFIRVLGLSRFTLRLPMLLVSLVTMPLMWDFTRRIAGKRFALLALLLTAINPWHMLQSRWALEANLMPHVMLLGMYLLLIGGRGCRPALYLSMALFGLTPYAYGLASLSAPVLLLLAAIFYVGRKQVRVPDLIVCVLIFALVSGPYYVTMMVNAFGWDTIQLGPITMPNLSASKRLNDLAIGHPFPFRMMISNLTGFFTSFLYWWGDEKYNVIEWAHTLYLFMPPAILWGMYILWRDRRALALGGAQDTRRDGYMLILVWLAAAVFNGMMVGAVVNRNNIVYYPLIVVCAYVLFQMGKRLRPALAVALVMLLVSFAGVNVEYFTDEDYQDYVGGYFHDGLQQALTDTWDWDYDHYYLSVTGNSSQLTFMRSQVMFAHGIDYGMLTEERELNGPDGEPCGWYFTERYAFVDYRKFTPDPMDCAVYIIRQGEKGFFPEEDYLITDYINYAVAYPRYWAE